MQVVKVQFRARRGVAPGRFVWVESSVKRWHFWLGIAVLVAFGVVRELATAYTLVLHAALWLPITLLGFFYMIREGLRWGDLSRASQLRESESSP